MFVRRPDAAPPPQAAGSTADPSSWHALQQERARLDVDKGIFDAAVKKLHRGEAKLDEDRAQLTRQMEQVNETLRLLQDERAKVQEERDQMADAARLLEVSQMMKNPSKRQRSV